MTNKIKNNRIILLIISLACLALATILLFFFFRNESKESSLVYGFIWTILSFSLSVFFYGILNTIAEIKGAKLGVNFTISGSGALLVILLYLGFKFIIDLEEKKLSNTQTEPSIQEVIKEEIDSVSIDTTIKTLGDETDIAETVRPPENPIDKSNYLTISGYITSTDNKAIQNASVKYNEFTAQTDKNGYFKLKFKNPANKNTIKLTCFMNGIKYKIHPERVGIQEKDKVFTITE